MRNKSICNRKLYWYHNWRERERGIEGEKYGGEEREINRHIPLSLHSLHCAQYWLQSIIKDNYLSKV